jgi:hypothetical protein
MLVHKIIFSFSDNNGSSRCIRQALGTDTKVLDGFWLSFDGLRGNGWWNPQIYKGTFIFICSTFFFWEKVFVLQIICSVLLIYGLVFFGVNIGMSSAKGKKDILYVSKKKRVIGQRFFLL